MDQIVSCCESLRVELLNYTSIVTHRRKGGWSSGWERVLGSGRKEGGGNVAFDYNDNLSGIRTY